MKTGLPGFIFLIIVIITLVLTSCTQSVKPLPLVQFDHLILPTSPNYCLATLTPQGKRQFLAPSFNFSAEKLRAIVMQLVQQQPRVKLLQQTKNQLQYVQRSALFRFPDIIDIRFIPIDKQQSRLLLYSRSLYGYSDFGVNCKRLNYWIKLLQTHLHKEQRS